MGNRDAASTSIYTSSFLPLQLALGGNRAFELAINSWAHPTGCFWPEVASEFECNGSFRELPLILISVVSA